MNIQWFPGHMTKTQRMMEENIRLIDIVIEIVDARLPLSSRNPKIDEIAGSKPRLLLLNKQSLNKQYKGIHKSPMIAPSERNI